MNMNSRERVIRSIEFRKPDKYPIIHVVLPTAINKHGEEIHKIYQKYPHDFGSPDDLFGMFRFDSIKHGTQKIYIDAWGCIWNEKTKGLLGAMIKPALESWDDLDNLKTPDSPLCNEQVFKKEKNRIQENKKQWYILGKYDFRYGDCLRGYSLFQRLFWLRGFENILIDFIENKKKVVLLTDKIMEHLTDSIKKCLDLGVDGILFADDWGTQRSLMVNPSFWRDFFKPYYQKLFAIVHEADAHVWFHSDGQISEIIPDLIEIGVDVLNPQLSLMDFEKFGELVNGKVCILTDLDQQHLLPRGTPEEIQQYIRDIIRYLGNSEGGLILRGCVGSDVLLGNIEAMLSAFETYRHFK